MRYLVNWNDFHHFKSNPTALGGWKTPKHLPQAAGLWVPLREHICGGEMGGVEQVELRALCTVETGGARGTAVRNRLMWEAIVISGGLPPVAIGGHLSVCGLGWRLRLC